MMNSALTLHVRPLPAGREYAEKLAKQYGMRDPEKLAKQLGLNVDYPDMPQNAERVLFAEFREPNNIHIYMDGVRKGRALLSEPGCLPCADRPAGYCQAAAGA